MKTSRRKIFKISHFSPNFFSYGIVCFFALTFLSSPAKSQEATKLPLFELGLGGMGAWLPDYPGSSQSRFRNVFLPYGIYRGQVLRADRENGVRTYMLKRAGYELNLSFGAAFPANSSQNTARKGMPNLDWMAEIGPQVRLIFWQGTTDIRPEIKLPLRFVYSTNFRDIQSRGVIINPEFSLAMLNSIIKGASTRWMASATFASDGVNGYFYDVDPQYATADRMAYQASSGFLGMDYGVSQSIPLGSLNLFFYYRYANYKGSANSASPLLKSQESHSAGLGLLWIAYKSTQNVHVQQRPLLEQKSRRLISKHYVILLDRSRDKKISRCHPKIRRHLGGEI